MDGGPHVIRKHYAVHFLIERLDQVASEASQFRYVLQLKYGLAECVGLVEFLVADHVNSLFDLVAFDFL